MSTGRLTTFVETTTLVLGYWRVGGNPKRDAQHYEALIDRTLAQIAGSRCIFLGDDAAFAALVSQAAASNNVELVNRHVSLTDLPSHAVSEDFVQCCRNMPSSPWFREHDIGGEKGLVHYWKHLRPTDEETYRQMLTIWLSKVPLMRQVALEENPFDTARFAWVDVSVARFNERRTNWDFTRVAQPAGKLSHYRSPMVYQGHTLPLNASFMAGEADVWEHVGALFDHHLARARQDAYGHDEETILGLCHAERPDLFHELGVPVPRPPQRRRTTPGLLSGVKQRLRRLMHR